MIRQISISTHIRLLGAMGMTPKGKKRVGGDIEKITIAPSTAAGTSVLLQVEGNAGGMTFNLTPQASMDIIKGLLDNLPQMYVAADDELLRIIEAAVGEARRNARGVVEAVLSNKGV